MPILLPNIYGKYKGKDTFAKKKWRHISRRRLNKKTTFLKSQLIDNDTAIYLNL